MRTPTKLILVTLLVSQMLLIGYAHADTPVGGIITTDTTWTKASSPYTLTSNIFVPQGITLTIQAGVTVYMNDHAIKVNGTLNARGIGSNRIIFSSDTPTLWNSPGVIAFLSGTSSWNEQAQTGSIIEYATITSVEPVPTIYIENSSPKINYCFVTTSKSPTTFTIEGGSSVISNCTITSYAGGGIGTEGILFEANAFILSNKIFNCYIGVFVEANANVQNNLLINNQEGLQVASGLKAIIQNNTIANNERGIGRFTPVFNLDPDKNILLYNKFIDNTSAYTACI